MYSDGYGAEYSDDGEVCGDGEDSGDDGGAVRLVQSLPWRLQWLMMVCHLDKGPPCLDKDLLLSSNSRTFCGEGIIVTLLCVCIGRFTRTI